MGPKKEYFLCNVCYCVKYEFLGKIKKGIRESNGVRVLGLDTLCNVHFGTNVDFLVGRYTVTRPYEGFRHPDWMAPESTVRGRENDSLVRPGYLHSLLTSFSGGSGIFRRFTL
jgi:hypothetical protein